MWEALAMPVVVLVTSAVLLVAASMAGVHRGRRGAVVDLRDRKKGRTMTDAEFSALVDEEGGILEALENGVSAEELEDGDLKDAWQRLDYTFDELNGVINELEDLLAEAEASEEAEAEASAEGEA